MAPCPDRLTATGKTRDVDKQARDNPADGPRPKTPPLPTSTPSGGAPLRAAPLTSAAPPMSKACMPASKMRYSSVPSSMYVVPLAEIVSFEFPIEGGKIFTYSKRLVVCHPSSGELAGQWS